MLIRVFLGILLSCVFCAGLAHAQTAEEIADHIQHSYETMRSFDATFVQKQTRAMINSVNTSGGVIRYRNPSLVRWETLEPEEAREIIVVGPEYVWDYVLETKNAAKMHVSDAYSAQRLCYVLFQDRPTCVKNLEWKMPGKALKICKNVGMILHCFY